jgi:hypothetical protein
MKTFLRSVLMALIASLASGAISPQPPVTQVIAVSGSSVTIENTARSFDATFEETETGGPATVSITVAGCMPNGSCDAVADTNTSTSTHIRAVAFTKVYHSFVVTASWTGGTSVKVSITPVIANVKKGGTGSGATTCSGLSDAAPSCSTDATLVANVVGAERTSNKNAANGYAGLDAGTKIAAAQLPTATTTTLGGVKDLAAVANNFITSIVGGVPVQARPNCGNLSDSGTGCSATLAAVATSGSATDLGSGTTAVARGGTGLNSVAANGLPYGAGTSPMSILAAATTNCAWLLQANVTASTAVAPAWGCPGVATNAQTGTTYTVLFSDRLSYVSFSNASPIAVTLPQAGSTGFASNFGFIACDIGAGTATITPTTSTISYSDGTSYTAGASTLVLTTGQCTYVYSDNSNYFAILRRTEVPVVAGGGNGTVSASSSSFMNMFGAGTPNATENTKQQDFPFTGILRNLCVRISAAQPSSGSLTIILHNATTNADVTGLSVVIAASSGAGKYCDTTNTSAIIAGNDYTWKLTEGVTNISATVTGVSAIYRY